LTMGRGAGLGVPLPADVLGMIGPAFLTASPSRILPTCARRLMAQLLRDDRPLTGASIAPRSRRDPRPGATVTFARGVTPGGGVSIKEWPRTAASAQATGTEASTMAEMMRWEPRREFASLREEVDRMFRQMFGTVFPGDGEPIAGAWCPVVDLEELDDAFVVHTELPGVDVDDVEVSVDQGVLTITGERSFYEDKEREEFRHIERHYGKFHRAIRLAAPVDEEAVEASYNDGLLTVRLPKAEVAKPHKIHVKTG
jgi:HSP20 family protein